MMKFYGLPPIIQMTRSCYQYLFRIMQMHSDSAWIFSQNASRLALAPDEQAAEIQLSITITEVRFATRRRNFSFQVESF